MRIVRNFSLFLDSKMYYAAHGIRGEFLSIYIGKFEEELLTHIMLLYTDKHRQGHVLPYFLFTFLTKSAPFQASILSPLAKCKHQFN